MDWEAIWLSVQLASLTTLILFVIGLPFAYWLANTRWRFKFMVEAVVSLPMILPPTVLGFYLLIAMGAQSPFGRAYEAITGAALPFSVWALLLASIFYTLPFPLPPFIPPFAARDP